MKKVAWRNAEYIATLPPYRFAPGDVVEIEDDWADTLIRRGIASTAKNNAKTIQQIRIDSRPPVPTAADERAVRRAALQAELDALDREGGHYTADVTGPVDEGHYSDTMTREDVGAATEQPAEGAPSGGAARHTAQSSGKK